MSTEILNKLLVQFKGNSIITYSELYSFIKSQYPNLAEKTISWHIYKLKSKGVITHVSRGIYSLKKKNEYIPEIYPYLKKTFTKVKTNFPYLNVCIWDSRWFNEFMIHQLFRYYVVVETERDATSTIFNTLSDFNKNVFLNPNREIFDRYINNQNEVIIVKPLISEAPLLEIDKTRIAAIEKLLIDCLIDKDLFAAQQDEIDNIYKTVFEKYVVNLNKLRRYARRRNQLIELENKINKLNLIH